MVINKAFIMKILLLFIALFNHNKVHSIPTFPMDKTDIIRIASSHSKMDVRANYTFEVLQHALRLSVDKYGQFQIEKRPISMSNDVTFYELSRGKIINVAMGGATPDKDHLATPIRIPIRRGILNYRLLVINKEKRDDFKKINSCEYKLIILSVCI